MEVLEKRMLALETSVLGEDGVDDETDVCEMLSSVQSKLDGVVLGHEELSRAFKLLEETKSIVSYSDGSSEERDAWAQLLTSQHDVMMQVADNLKTISSLKQYMDALKVFFFFFFFQGKSGF